MTKINKKQFAAVPTWGQITREDWLNARNHFKNQLEHAQAQKSRYEGLAQGLRDPGNLPRLIASWTAQVQVCERLLSDHINRGQRWHFTDENLPGQMSFDLFIHDFTNPLLSND